MKKRLLSIILTLCMVMSITPLNAFAVTEYGIWIGDEQVTSDKTWSKQGWKYDIQSKTLTLLGYNMATIGKRINGNSERPSRFGLIYVEGEQDLNIKLVGSLRHIVFHLQKASIGDGKRQQVFADRKPGRGIC